MIRWILFFGLVFFSLWLPGVYKRTTHGFFLNKCRLEWPTVPSWETPECDPKLLEQPFTYLAKGTQSYVFLSQNGDYVLKLFHFKTSKIPVGKNLKNRWKKWMKGRGVEHFPFKESVVNTFGSYKLAFDLAQDLTGLIYIHLNPKKTSLPMIRIKDRVGRSYKIDPAKYRFVIQRRAEPFVPTLSKAMEEDSIQPLVESCHSLFKKIEERGLFDRDPNLTRNFAFLDGQPIIIDAGSLSHDPSRAPESSNKFRSRLKDLLEREYDLTNNPSHPL